MLVRLTSFVQLLWLYVVLLHGYVYWVTKWKEDVSAYLRQYRNMHIVVLRKPRKARVLRQECRPRNRVEYKAGTVTTQPWPVCRMSYPPFIQKLWCLQMQFRYAIHCIKVFKKVRTLVLQELMKLLSYLFPCLCVLHLPSDESQAVLPVLVS